MHLLRVLLVGCAGCSTVSIGGVRGVTGRLGVAASMSDGRVMHTGQMDMEMPGMAGVAVTSHQAGSQEETKAQQKTENENQGKRISSDHRYSLLSRQCLPGLTLECVGVPPCRFYARLVCRFSQQIGKRGFHSYERTTITEIKRWLAKNLPGVKSLDLRGFLR